MKHLYRDTVTLIADILSFETLSTDLKQKLTATTESDWERLVKIASEHLVLPTLFCRLEQKGLIALLPNDLTEYLKEIASINRHRNQTILREIKDITTVLDTHQIEYVLIKGSAMLAGNYYQDIAERMVGDIDILVAEPDTGRAFELLKAMGYDQLVAFNYDHKGFRHLPRQIHPDKLASVEIHESVLNQNYRQFINESTVLSNTLKTNGFNIPNVHHLNLINILSYQISSSGYFYRQWHLKNLYDSLILNLPNDTNITKSDHPIIRDYFAKFQAFFCHPQYKNSHQKGLVKYYLFKIKHPLYHRFFYRIKFIYRYLKLRISQLLSNKSYRQHVLNHLYPKKS